MPIIIYTVYYFKLPTPMSIILKPMGIKYWSVGLTTASVQILKLNFKNAYQINPLIYLVLIIGLFHVFLEPVAVHYLRKYKK